MKNALNISLFISFAVAIMPPVTGIHVHKLAASIFLLLGIVHMIIYRKKIGRKRRLLLILVFVSFFSGLFGMIFDQFLLLLNIHRISSIAMIFFLAIHVYMFRKNFNKNQFHKRQTIF